MSPTKEIFKQANNKIIKVEKTTLSIIKFHLFTSDNDILFVFAMVFGRGTYEMRNYLKTMNGIVEDQLKRVPIVPDDFERVLYTKNFRFASETKIKEMKKRFSADKAPVLRNTLEENAIL